MSETKVVEPTTKINEGVNPTTEKTEAQIMLEQTQKEFAEYREKQEAIAKSKEQRFFKEGATKVESKLRELHGIDDKLTGDELYKAIENKLKTEVEKTKVETTEETIKKLEIFEKALKEKEEELNQYKYQTELTKKKNQLKAVANPILNSGVYKLNENGMVNEQRLASVLSNIESLNIDFSGVEPIIMGEDNLPMYSSEGKKLTLAEKIKEGLNVFFDQAPKGQPSLSLLNGEGKKIEITSSIEEIDKQLKTAKTQEEFLKLSGQKAKLINEQKQ